MSKPMLLFGVRIAVVKLEEDEHSLPRYCIRLAAYYSFRVSSRKQELSAFASAVTARYSSFKIPRERVSPSGSFKRMECSYRQGHIHADSFDIR